MRQQITTALELIGGALVVTGTALVYVPAAFMAAGAGCVCVGYLIGRNR